VDLETAPSGLSYAHAGDLVYVDIGANFAEFAGAVGTISYDSSITSAPVARASADRVQGSSPLKVNFTGSASSDADTYAWDFGDGSTSNSADPQHSYATSGTYTATLTVTDTDDHNATDSATVRVTVDGPKVALDYPATDSLYQDGSPLPLHGTATDANAASIPDANLRWQVILHHGSSHVHQLGWFGNGASFTPLVDHGADSWYDVTLYATDGAGLTGWNTVSVFPKKVSLTLASNPSGAPITYVGRSLVAPLTATEAVGFRGSLSAADQFMASDGGTYVFDSWSDGAPRTRTLVVGDGPVALTANYHRVGAAQGAAGGQVGAALGGGGLTTAGGSKPVSADRSGPDLRIGALAASLRRGRLTGTVFDPSGVRGVDVSVRARHRNRLCRWWSTVHLRLGVARSCTSPAWVRARITGRSWTASLGGSVPRGSYLVYVRAIDRRGNVTSHIIAVERR
jgi:PKD repeat protein